MTTVIIKLNARLQPIHRHDLEDGLEASFNHFETEIELTGGGTLQAEDGEILSCDIELQLADPSEENLGKVIRIMESMLGH